LLFTRNSPYRPKPTLALGESIEKDFLSKWPLKTGRIALLLSDKVDFKPKLVRRDKSHFILIKGAIQQEEITIVNLQELNDGISNFIKQMLLDLKFKHRLNSMTMILGDTTVTNR
jgi:hypothetical protein